MFEGSYPAQVRKRLDRELRESHEHEITEQEWICELLDEERRRQITPLTDTEAIAELIKAETTIAEQQARRARLVALLAQNRPASADRPTARPGAASQGRASTVPDEDAVPEVLGVSEWLAHELQMAHPYSWPAAQDLVQTSLVLTGRLSATLDLLAAGGIDYRRAHILTDLLGTCSEPVAHTVQAIVLPRAPGLTPGGLAAAVRRALARVDAAALRRRHTRARRAADVGYWPTADGMARLFADLPLPVAAACADAVRAYAKVQHTQGDDRPIGQIRTEILTDLILRPWDTTRPPVTGQVTIHLTIPTQTTATRTSGQTGTGRTGPGARCTGTGGVLADDAAEADVDGQVITAAQCRELLGQLQASRLFLALHTADGRLTAVATPAQLRRAARRTRRTRRAGRDRADRPGLRPPPATGDYRPTRELDRHVRTRDRTCRHFGCTRKAIHADLDHHRPWPDGPTQICNLCAYCRTHHRLKHQAPGWTRHLLPDGTLRITTPTGTTRTTRPPGPEPDPPAVADPESDHRPATLAANDDPPPF